MSNCNSNPTSGCTENLLAIQLKIKKNEVDPLFIELEETLDDILAALVACCAETGTNLDSIYDKLAQVLQINIQCCADTNAKITLIAKALCELSENIEPCVETPTTEEPSVDTSTEEELSSTTSQEEASSTTSEDELSSTTSGEPVLTTSSSEEESSSTSTILPVEICTQLEITVAPEDIADSTDNTLYDNGTVYLEYTDCDEVEQTQKYTIAGTYYICVWEMAQVTLHYYKGNLEKLSGSSSWFNTEILCLVSTTTTEFPT